MGETRKSGSSLKKIRFIPAGAFGLALLIAAVLSVSSLCTGNPPAWEVDRDPERLRLIDGEGEPYRSAKFEVQRPSPTPFPALHGTDRYAYFIDGPGRHVEQLTEHLYEQAWLFSEELGAVKQDGRWGYIDRSGEYIIQSRFEWAEPFSEGLAAVKYDGYYGFIDHSGAFVIEPRFLAARYFSMDLAPVKVEEGWLYIDQNGNVVIAGPFEMAESFSSVAGLAAVRVEGKWGFIDDEGSMIMDPRFDDAWAFVVVGTSLEAAVRLEGDWVYIDTSGQIK